MTNQFDVILVGAGHNGLAAACYLAKAGYKVLALERRNIVGGAVVTESDIFPGFKLDTCSSFHVVIHGTPVVSELELEKFGLEYIDVDPWAFAPFPNGNYIIFYRDVDRTAETIARFSPHDAEAYRKFMRRWMKFNETIMEVFCTPPRISQVAKKIIPREIKHRGEFTRMGINPFMLRDILSPYGKVIERTFESPEVRGALVWLGAQSGPGLKEMASGEPNGNATKPVSYAGSTSPTRWQRHAHSSYGALPRTLRRRGTDLRRSKATTCRARNNQGG